MHLTQIIVSNAPAVLCANRCIRVLVRTATRGVLISDARHRTMREIVAASEITKTRPGNEH